jgi:hypothetical protein
MIEVSQILQNKNADLNEISAEMNSLEFHEIGCVNWQNAAYKPHAKFAIAHNDIEIFIKYAVRERYIRAVYSNNNDSVCKDSCCEFFVSPDCNDCFYNFETNCIGTLRLGYRKLGEKSVHSTDELTCKVRRLSSLGNSAFDTQTGDFSWEMLIAIPLQAFFMHSLASLSGKTFTANFYKCGDDLPNPHYLSRSPIKTEKPSFHQPAFFEKIVFN